MIPHTVRWLVFLALIKNFSWALNPFALENSYLTAKEGSCVEIKCKPNLRVAYSAGAYWFWMKDATWSQMKHDFNAKIVYSTDQQKKPIDTQFNNRSTPGSPLINHHKSEELCHILICDLNKSDSGNYTFRYVNGDEKWVTDLPTKLTVEDNPCPITFKKQETVMENQQVTLTCSTSASCSSQLEIRNSTLNPPISKSQTPKTITHSFNANWMNDGNVFSCQTSGNTDKYLIRNLTLTVEHAPKDVQITTSHKTVKENDAVTLNCSTKGHPKVSFSWFKNNTKMNPSGPEMIFTSIKESDSGWYHCRAENKHGAINSTKLNINVLYPPEVTVDKGSAREALDHVLEGDKVTLTCTVKRSKPPPTEFTWFQNGTKVLEERKESYHLLRVKPENHGVYRCEAKNDVGSGKSNNRFLHVQYKPRSHISIDGSSNGDVKIHSSVTFRCNTAANPSPEWYSWYRYHRSDPSNWEPMETKRQTFVQSIKRADEACYMCNTSNTIGEGEMSKPKCIRVLFPPTNVMLSLPHKVTEGQTVNIRCSAESFPISTFQLRKSSSSNRLASKPGDKENTATFTFTATLADAVAYTCVASNKEGENRSAERKLNVEYSPKDVRTEPQADLEVKENEKFSLECMGHSNPPIDSYTWIKKVNNEEMRINTSKKYSVSTASPSDSGSYRCEASNTAGIGKSQPVEVKVKYAPKYATITRGKEERQSDGWLSVMLTCTSQSYPQAKYVWYNKTTDTTFSDSQTVKVYSYQPGELYCVAENDLGRKTSDPIRTFNNRMGRTVTIFLICFILLVIILIFLYRHKNKYNPRGTNMLPPCCGFLVCQKDSRRRKRMNETIMAEPSRSREDLLTEQLHCPKAQRPHPDATPSSDINTVYATVDLPQRQAPSAPAGHEHNDDSLNYASLHFEKNKKPNEDPVCSRICKPKSSEDDPVYSKVCKPKEMEHRIEDYENLSPFKVKPENDYDSDTSEEEVEVHYTQVNFKTKPGHQKTTSNSSSSEDDIQYSQVKL